MICAIITLHIGKRKLNMLWLQLVTVFWTLMSSYRTKPERGFMKVLVACEESQEVCKAFRKRGHEAYSCDVQECSGGHPEWRGKIHLFMVKKSSFAYSYGDSIGPIPESLEDGSGTGKSKEQKQDISRNSFSYGGTMGIERMDKMNKQEYKLLKDYELLKIDILKILIEWDAARHNCYGCHYFKLSRRDYPCCDCSRPCRPDQYTEDQT